MRTPFHRRHGRLRRTRRGEEDRRVYTVIAQELADGDREPGLWADAWSEAGGDAAWAETLYVRCRAAQLRREMEAFKDGLLGADVDRLASAPPPIDAGRWSPAYQRVLDAAGRGTLRLGLVYYAAFALVFALLVVLGRLLSGS